MSKNPGKKFEEDFKNSIPEEIIKTLFDNILKGFLKGIKNECFKFI